MAETQIPEDKTAPDIGDKVGDKAWKAAPEDGNRVCFADAYGFDAEDAKKSHFYMKIKEVRIAYAHTWVYADKACAVTLRCDPGEPGHHQTGAKIWVNGTPSLDASGGVGCWGEIGGYGYKPVNLKEGWNSILVKCWAWKPTWGFTAWIENEPPKDVKYEEKNIRWRVPTLGWGRAQPVAVGGRIFHCVEPFYLNCYDAETGKLMWIRHFEYFGAMLPEWKKKAGSISVEYTAQAGKALQEIDRLNDEIVRQSNEGKPVDALLQERGKNDGVLGGIVGGGLMEKVDPERNKQMAGAWEQGQPTRALAPCSDGKNVYAFHQNAVAAAFTLDGKPLWKTALPHPGNNHHGFACNPVLIGDRLILKQFKFTALDARTGQIVWEAKGGCAHASSTYAFADGMPIYVGNAGSFLKAADGKPYAGDEGKGYLAGSIASPTRFGDNMITGPGQNGFVVCALEKGAVRTSMIPEAGAWIASPVVCNGILFTMYGTDGDIGAYDLATGKRLWRRQFEMNIRQQAHGQPGATANLISAGKYVYCFDDYGTCIVFEAARQFKQVARNTLHSYTSMWNWGGPQVNAGFGSSPIIHRNRLYFQFNNQLWCIGEK